MKGSKGSTIGWWPKLICGKFLTLIGAICIPVGTNLGEVADVTRNLEPQVALHKAPNEDSDPMMNPTARLNSWAGMIEHTQLHRYMSITT
jgi:hypothetical protein